MMKKTLKVAGITLLLLLLITFSIPFLFKGKITTLVKEQVNKNLTAKVDFADVDLSLFRHFPRLSVALDSLRVTGTGEFAEDTLLSATRIDVALNLLSVLGNEMQIHSIRVDQPRIHALMHRNGHANWMITIPDTAASTPSTGKAASKPFKMALQSYSIRDGYIRYQDDSSHMSGEIAGLNHSGSGDFTSDLFTLKTSTSIESLSFADGAIPYLVNAHTNLVADFGIDNKAAKYSFKIDDLSVNDLKLHTEGFFQMMSDSVYNMDIAFNGPSLDFKSILSLVPSIYRKDFASIRATGQASLSGFVKGVYDSRHIPAYHADLQVKNGNFQYPDLPKPVKNINLSLKADNPDGVTDHATVDISEGHLEMDDAPFDFRLLVKTPVSDPYVDAAAKGRLDLAKVAQFVKLEKGTLLKGLLNADVNLKGNLSDIQPAKAGSTATPSFDHFNAGGTIGLSGFSYASAAYPDPVSLDNLLLTFNPRNVTLNDLKGSYQQTHFAANGFINNLLSYMLKNKPLDGSLTLKADKVNLNDLMGTAGTDSTGNASKATGSPTTSATPKNTTVSTPFTVPSNISFVINAAADQVHYNNLDLQNITGKLIVADETVRLENIRGEGLGGTMLINGAYSTKESKKNPAIAFNYDVKGLDVQKTFYAFTTVQKLMPVGKFIAGRFSSQLAMKGKMGDNNTPDLNSLTGDGNLQLAEGALKNFAPTDKLAQTLQLDQFKDILVKDIKTIFSFENGKVKVNPFHLKVKDIDMAVGGSHGFDQSLDYSLNLTMPRSLLGGQAGSLVNNLAGHAGGLKVDDKISLPVSIGGTLTNPVLKTDVKQALNNTAQNLKQQATDLVKAKADTVKGQVRDSVKSVQKQLVKDAGHELAKQLTGQKDTSGTQAQGSGLDNSKKKVEETGKGLLNNLFNKKKSQ